MTALQQNTLDHLIGTLEKLADFEDQRRYKQAVPFVHIPIELAEQWSNYPRLLDANQDWFTSLLTDVQTDAIRTFDAIINEADLSDDFPDVDEAFALPSWVAVREGAQVALNAFRNTEANKAS